MKKANISELKNNLSRYLRFVRDGQSVLVYDRDLVIARIDPVTAANDSDDGAWIAQLETTGALRRPSAKLPANWLRRRAAARADVVAALLEERESAR